MARIGFDLDGVIYRFTKQYNLWMNLTAGMNLDLELEADSWNWFENWQTTEQFLACMDAAVDAKHLFWQGDLCESTIPDNLRALRAAGHTIHIVTNRYSGKILSSEEATRHFLHEKEIIYDTLTFSADKTVVSTDYFIEDNINNYLALDHHGVLSYIVNRPYNEAFSAKRRISTVDEFTKIILEGDCDLDRTDNLSAKHLGLGV